MWEDYGSRRGRESLEWAEDELWLAEGPYARRGPVRFRALPWQRLVLAEHSRWSRNCLLAGVQMGKTVIGSMIPLGRSLCELRESAVLFAPTMQLALSAWQRKLRPLFEHTRYRALLPTHGAGSRGGMTAGANSLLIGGVPLWFMGAGGSDAQKSSITARTVVATEAALLGEIRHSSRQTSPLRQAEARTAAFGDEAQFFLESVPSTEEGAEWREWLGGTRQQIEYPCVACGAVQWWGRESLTGWQEAQTEREAGERARLVCSACGALHGEAERAEFLAAPALSAPRAGAMTSSIRACWVSSPEAMVPIHAIAEEEWRLAREPDESLLRRLLQHRWCEPWRSELMARTSPPADAATILSRISARRQGEVPPGARVVHAIDPGGHVCWWSTWAWRPGGRGSLVGYGREAVVQGDSVEPEAVLEALRRIRSRLGPAALVLVDAGAFVDQVYRLGKEPWPGGRVLPAKGQRGEWRAGAKPGPGERHGAYWAIRRQLASHVDLVEHASDAGKQRIADGWRAAPGAVGALDLPLGEHLEYVQHLTAERREERVAPGRGVVVSWRQLRANHWLDCAVLAALAAEILGLGAGARAVPLDEPGWESRVQGVERPWERDFRGLGPGER